MKRRKKRAPSVTVEVRRCNCQPIYSISGAFLQLHPGHQCPIHARRS